MKKMFFAAAGLALGVVAVTALPAAARVVCNGYGDCWHVDTQYDYGRYDKSFHAQYHDDDWYFHQRWANNGQTHWRDHHDGRGYYKNGVWLSF
jgi:hypothetical protein